ncbi:MAG: CaiB/BaiF CoA transferase family protein, partial [Dehalococcoidia bacterium]
APTPPPPALSHPQPPHPQPPKPACRLPLEGVRVLDLTMVWAGPFATKFLADMGAEVLKVESLNHIDSRLWAGFAYKDATAENIPYARDNYVVLFSRNKLGITLDLGTEIGRNLFLQLVAISDVVIENFAAGVLDRLGLDFETLRGVNPRIILAGMPGFGNDGPERDFVAYGTTLEALSGLAGITGYAADEPHKSGINYGDPVAGMHAAGAVMAALHRMRRTGHGELIEVAQLESLIMLLGETVVDYSMNGCSTTTHGNADPLMAPQGVYPCRGADRWLALTLANDEEWEKLVDLLGRPVWASGPELATAAGRRRQTALIDAHLANWTRDQDQMELMKRLQAAGLRAGAVLDAAQVLADPHLTARGLFVEVDHPDGRSLPLAFNPWRCNGRREPVRRRAPALGEDNDYVFHDLLGLNRSQIDELERRRISGRLPILGEA